MSLTFVAYASLVVALSTAAWVLVLTLSVSRWLHAVDNDLETLAGGLDEPDGPYPPMKAKSWLPQSGHAVGDDDNFLRG